MTLIEFGQILTYLSNLILFAGFILSVIKWGESKPISKSLTVYIAILLGSAVLMYVVARIFSDNIIVLYIYSFSELAFMLYFFKRHMFLKKQLLLTILGIAGLLYILAEMLLVFVFKGLVIKEFQPYAKVVDNFVIVLMTLAYLHEKMSRYGESVWGSFRLNMVFLVFFTLNTILFLPFNFMVNAAGNVKFYFWTGHIILLILFYLYLTFEIWSNGRRTTPRSAIK